MKPLEFDRITVNYLSSEPLFMVNTTMANLHWVRKLIAYAPTSVISKGGIALPPEVWSMILQSAFSSAKTEKNDYCFARATLVSSTEKKKVLRCERVEVAAKCGELEDSAEVSDFESFVEAAARSDKFSYKKLSGLDDTFYLSVNSPPGGTIYLYTDIEVPDVIARMEGGACRVCGDERWVCLPCDGSVEKRFGVSSGSDVSVSCPLCMGREMTQLHLDFLDSYYYGACTEADEDEIEDELEERLRELGYKPSDFAPFPTPRLLEDWSG